MPFQTQGQVIASHVLTWIFGERHGSRHSPTMNCQKKSTKPHLTFFIHHLQSIRGIFFTDFPEDADFDGCGVSDEEPRIQEKWMPREEWRCVLFSQASAQCPCIDSAWLSVPVLLDALYNFHSHAIACFPLEVQIKTSPHVNWVQAKQEYLPDISMCTSLISQEIRINDSHLGSGMTRLPVIAVHNFSERPLA